MVTQTIYDIYTEDKNRVDIIDILLGYGIDNFTLINAGGFYDFRQEMSLIIRIISSEEEYICGNIANVCEDIRRNSEQEQVVLVTYPCTIELFEGDHNVE